MRFRSLALAVAAVGLWSQLSEQNLTLADWPDHRGNLQRTAFVEQKLDTAHWEFGWSFDYLTAPEAAWPPPARGSLWQELNSIEPRVNDDQADVPIIARDANQNLKVLVASSANDRLVCIDPATGQLQWEFVAQAPIRFAPTVREGIVYFGADDGRVRAMTISDGRLLWSSHIGPNLEQIIGNGRFISPHPIRTSVLCHNGQVFACAGLFPSQGVYSVSLDASDGTVNWRRQLNKSPQGYMLLADDERLIIPEGRSAPFMLALKDGQSLESLPSPGGSFCMLTPDAFFAGPGNAPRVESYPLDENFRPRKREDQTVMLPFEGRANAAGNGRIWVATGKQLVCYDAQRVLNQLPESEVWSVACSLRQSLIVSGPSEDLQLFVADGDTIQVYQADSGELLHTLTVPGTVPPETTQQLVYLAVSASRSVEGFPCATLVATARSGRVFCWHGYTAADYAARQYQAPQPQLPSDFNRDPAIVENQPVRKTADEYLRALPVTTGAILVIGDCTGSLSAGIAAHSGFRVVSILEEQDRCEYLQHRWQLDRIYGQKVTVQHVPSDQSIPFVDELFNAVIEVGGSNRSASELMRLLAAGSGRLFQHDKLPQGKAPPENTGSWRHQYGNPANHSATLDDRLGTADSFRLKWFGGVGPQPMPDRHLRGQAPLAAGASLVMHADGILIGVDPANGFERWRITLPSDSMRYVMPYDCGYSCMTLDGQSLYTCTSDGIWQLDCLTGQRQGHIPVPELNSLPVDWKLPSESEYRWGYLAESNGLLYSTLMKTTAPRLAINDRATARQRYTDQDYNSGRPLVCSRSLHCMSPVGQERWRYLNGVIINSSISLQMNDVKSRGDSTPGKMLSGQIVFVESHSPDSLGHATDRIPLTTLMQKAFLVCLEAENGESRWQIPLQWQNADNILYTQIADNYIVLVSSSSDEPADRASYVIRVHNLQDGELIWQQTYPHIKEGLYHGEQVHHPVVLQQPSGHTLLIVEPYLYDLKTGQRTVPNGAAEDWSLKRPGHSCGSLSGCGFNLFFRANNPTVLNLHSSAQGKFTSLSPSRPGCWINMIPAAGQLLIPEASASCVCHYPIQTSMAFVPIVAQEDNENQKRLEESLP